jgi:hypothetical protein
MSLLIPFAIEAVLVFAVLGLSAAAYRDHRRETTPEGRLELDRSSALPDAA